MATLLAHIRVKSRREDEFEALARELYRHTHETEPGMLRYEYWRGAEKGLYYSLLSFESFDAFLAHQLSDHHEEASPRIAEMCETLSLEWVDPVPGAAEAPSTEMRPLPDDADEKAALYHQVFAAKVQPWWRRDDGG
jgi:quinol monooxygenase YgiN